MSEGTHYLRFRVKRSPVWLYLTESFGGSALPNRAAKLSESEARQIAKDLRQDDKYEVEVKPFPRHP